MRDFIGYSSGMSYEHVTRTATCKRCGSTTVTWQRGGTGKWYLTEVFSYPRGDDGSDDMTAHTDFHSAYCNKPDVHAHKQNEIILNYQREREEADARAEEREQERIADEAAKLADWYSMTPEEQAAKIAKLESEIKATLEGITMDYFTEYCRAVAKADSIRAEIDMYQADDEDEGDE